MITDEPYISTRHADTKFEINNSDKRMMKREGEKERERKGESIQVGSTFGANPYLWVSHEIEVTPGSWKSNLRGL